jgi:hypothetical protein
MVTVTEMLQILQHYDLYTTEYMVKYLYRWCKLALTKLKWQSWIQE